MSTISINNINNQINNYKQLQTLFEQDDFENKLAELRIDWDSLLVSESSELVTIFSQFGFVSPGQFKLTRAGTLMLARIAIDFEGQLSNGTITGAKYRIISPLRIGKNSCTFLAEHVVLENRVVLKVLRPGAAVDFATSIRLISKIQNANLVKPTDYFKIDLKDVFGRLVAVECAVFPFVDGKSLTHFLNDDKRPLNAYAIASFIKQVGNVLKDLEVNGAYHGDLHEENIIVNTTTGVLSFYVIDVSFGVTGSLESELCKDNDLLFFRQHVWNFLSAQQRYLAKMSIRKYLGSEIFNIVSKVLSSVTMNFKEILALFDNNPEFNAYLKAKELFIRDKFTPPGSFKLQRYEEITDQAIALKLFVPFPEMMTRMKSFSNLVISGTRGSGKSTYLAAIAFFPKVDLPLVDHREIFGIYFPCRQGEFRLLSPDMINYQSLGLPRVKNVFVIKIIRRTLEALSEGIEYGKLSAPDDYSDLKEKLVMFLGGNEIVSLDTHIVSEIRNLVSILIRVEMKELDNLFNSKTTIAGRLASEVDILDFFKIVRQTFRELGDTTFHLLFDDAGSPNIPSEAQLIINDFIVSSNPIFCVKLCTEKYSYSFQTSNNKQLESGHDYTEYDINAIFYVGSKTFGMDSTKLENYFHKIVEERLKHFQYQSTRIQDYLGDDEIKLENLVNSLATGKRNAYYCGWAMTWRISDGNPRNLLELISEIFSVGNVNENSTPAHVSNRNQDRAIRSVSEKRLRSIAQISGTVLAGSKHVSLGQRLFNITRVTGTVFRIYLKAEVGKKRKNQYLAIERNEISELNPTADILLKELIRYGIFDESKLDFARDDQVKKPIYILNRIFCPTFAISFRRDQHLRLSRSKLEELLLAPEEFVTDGTRLLRLQESEGNPTQVNLFDDF